jgi:hypothetical protein
MRPQLSNKPFTGALTQGHTHYLFLRSLCNEQVAAVAQTPNFIGPHVSSGTWGFFVPSTQMTACTALTKLR